ncbi:14569_t:CDS:2 [Gigaspora margarita]|uniref:14569_t:CDS:1 n=1 Tax=Gigaspora margarita TaxID=4874 RepID=A0ABN7WST2_GIGMA|nr:14569_t:CDS:2 [Gigaspora margarita]
MPPRRNKTSTKPRKTTTTPAKSTFTRSGNRNNRTSKDYWINEYIQRIAYIERCKERFPGKDKTFFDDEVKQLKRWKKIIEESPERDVLVNKESLEQRFNDEKIKYEEKENKQLKRDILVNKREISKLEDKLAELERDYEAMQLDNDEKEHKIILLENEITSLSEDGAEYYKDLYNITIEENIRLKDKIEELQNELEAIKKNVVNLTTERNNARSYYDSLKKDHEEFQNFHNRQMKEQFDIEDHIRRQLDNLKRENERLESLLH